MTSLHTLENTYRDHVKTKRVGRGTGSGMGKTCGRGNNGAGARSGYKRRLGNEGGQLPLYRKLPKRGFSNVRFQKKLVSINLRQINVLFADGEVVNEDSLRMHGFINGNCYGVKILGDGDLERKVGIEVNAISSGARAKLEKLGIDYKVVA
ncbi:MAG: large subunit ribosomal protein L15 [Chlamydiales bacterium]|jgi:large subunit ribosomal protein L15